MKKFEGLLFCTDLDGTLYNSNREVSKENLDAIEYFKAEGGLFTFMTGRVPSTSVSIYETVKPNAPYGCLNGGGIYDPEKEAYLWSVCLPDGANELVREVDRKMPGMGIQYNTEKGIYFNKDNEAMHWFRKITGVPNVQCHYEDVKEPVLKIVFADMDPTQLEALAELLNSHPLASKFGFIRSERALYELLPKGVSKGTLLLKLAELLGIDPKRTIAAGDYNNDVAMLQVAGLGFAVSNAVDEAKAAADIITVSNDEHAIAAIIDGFDRGIYQL